MSAPKTKPLDAACVLRNKISVDDRARRVMELRSELFTLANTFAGAEAGYIAVLLHEACNKMLSAMVLCDKEYGTEVVQRP
jgi:hypothetical protein